MISVEPDHIAGFLLGSLIYAVGYIHGRISRRAEVEQAWRSGVDHGRHCVRTAMALEARQAGARKNPEAAA